MVCIYEYMYAHKYTHIRTRPCTHTSAHVHTTTCYSQLLFQSQADGWLWHSHGACDPYIKLPRRSLLSTPGPWHWTTKERPCEALERTPFHRKSHLASCSANLSDVGRARAWPRKFFLSEVGRTRAWPRKFIWSWKDTLRRTHPFPLRAWPRIPEVRKAFFLLEGHP